MLRQKTLAIVLILTIAAMGVMPEKAEAKKPWWKIVGGLLATGGAVAAGLTGAGGAVVAPLCGVETALLGTAAGGGSNNGGGLTGGISDSQPFYSGPIQPDFCGGGNGCAAEEALLMANLRPLPLPGTSAVEDNLTMAVNNMMASPLKDMLVAGDDLRTVQTEMLQMAAAVDSVILWLDELIRIDPANEVVFTNQTLQEAADEIAASGLPAPEVQIFLDAGLSPAQIDSIAAFHVQALRDITLTVEPITIQDVLRDAADDFRRMGMAVAGAGDLVPGAGITVDQNRPNPFNPSTVIAYELQDSGPLSIRIFNMRGELVRTLLDGQAAAGRGQVTWRGQDDHGRRVPSGIYFYRVQGGGADMVRKMTLLK